MKLSLREAFDLEPSRTIVVGGTQYVVPPLTFGRLDQLLRAQSTGAFSMSDFAAKFKGDTPEAVGRALAHFPTDLFADAAVAAIPGMTAAAWREHGTPYIVLELVLFFSKAHDWTFIGDALFGARGDPGDDSVPDLDMQTAILLMARELNCRIDEPLGFRAEGFFMAAGAIKSRYAAQREAQERAERAADGWEGAKPAEAVVPIQKNPAAVAGLHSLMAEAEARQAQEGATNG